HAACHLSLDGDLGPHGGLPAPLYVPPVLQESAVRAFQVDLPARFRVVALLRHPVRQGDTAEVLRTALHDARQRAAPAVAREGLAEQTILAHGEEPARQDDDP